MAVFVIVLSIWGLDCRLANAQTDPVAAEALFQDARSLMDKGRYTEACPKLAESQRLDPGVGTLMYLGLCYEESGKTASAWSTYRSAESAASNAHQADRAGIARQRALAIEPKLTKLIIRVAAGSPQDIQVYRDGVALGQAAWGTAVPVDAGIHVVTASAKGKVSWSFNTNVPPTSPESVVDIPLLADVPAATASPMSNDSTGAPRPGMVIDHDSNRGKPSSTQRWVGLGVGAVGLVGAAVGTVLMVSASHKSSEAESYRRPETSIYDGPGYDLNQDALKLSKWAVWSYVAGAAALGGGAFLYLTAPKPNQAYTANRLQANVSVNGVSIAWSRGWQ